jgi:universal bacterial protein YeaZ
MPLLLHIDTATEIATVSISDADRIIQFLINEQQKDHASFLQPAIKRLLQSCDLTFQQLSAISVTAGPGSYTGLRVGMASAKGLCYALKIPIILLNTLEVMAASAIEKIDSPKNKVLFCPMIDARRTEVFTAVYDQQLEEIIAPFAMKVETNSFGKLLDDYIIYFSGSGSEKVAHVIKHPNAKFNNIKILPTSLARIANQKFEKQRFIDVRSADALYIKEFFTI